MVIERAGGCTRRTLRQLAAARGVRAVATSVLVTATMSLATAAARAGDDAPPPAADGAAKPAAPAEAPKAEAAKAPETPKAVPPAAPAPPADDGRSALRSAVEGVVGTEVHGRFTLKWESRIVDGDHDETDHDLYGTLDLRVGDSARDEYSGSASVRGAWDLDQPNSRRSGSSFSSLADTYDSELSALLYTAWGQWRPKTGALETVRVGRQYIDVAESFHFDGAAVATKPLDEKLALRLKVYGGVPVHYYEAPASGDWLAGVQASAEPWKDGRAAIDYAHVEDELSGYDDQRNDLAAVSVWQRIGKDADLFGRFTWLDGPSDFRLRGTVSFPESDLLVQASYKRLLDDKEDYATEFDPYFRTLRTLREYHLGDVRAVKGFGENFQVEVGASARELVHESDEGPFNRETARVWLMPSVDDLLWKGSTLTAGIESWSGDGERIKTWSADLTHRFDKNTRASIGSDYSLYDYGELRLGERSHVRSAYGRFSTKLSDHLNLDFRYAWERDEEDTYHVVSLAVSVDF